MKRRGVQSKDKGQGKAEEKVDEDGERARLGGSNSALGCKGKLPSLFTRNSGSIELSTSTPVLPWKNGGRAALLAGGAPEAAVKPYLFLHPLPPPVPARRVAAAVWEFFQYYSPSGAMNFVTDRTHPHQRRRDDHRHHHHRQLLEKGDLGVDHRINLGGPFQSSAEHQPAAASKLGRQVAALIAQNHRSMAQNHRHPPQLHSPASYESSLEINPYNQSSAPTSSVEFRARVGEPSHGFKASSELLKVLNRIWTLEERHESDMSLVKSLKIELSHGRAKIKELLRDQHATRHKIDNLMNQADNDNLASKSKKQERTNTSVESLRAELEDERRLRKRSEGLHRRLAREVFEVKVALSTSLKQNEKERMSRRLLEELCDEFAKGIIEYEREIHDLRQKNGMNWNESGDCRIVQMSESWLDERVQMKNQEEEDTVAEKLQHEIEDFVGAQKMVGSKDRRLRRNSLESMLLNEAGSAPRCLGNEDSAVSSKGTINRLMGETLVSEGGGAVDRSTARTAPQDQASKEKLKGKVQEQRSRGGYRSRLKGSS